MIPTDNELDEAQNSIRLKKMKSIFYRGKSMYPTLHNFDLLNLSPCSRGTVHLGDIIAFKLPEEPRIVVHRVIAIQEGGIVTRGDANFVRDSTLVQLDDIIGSVDSIERNGHQYSILKGYTGLLFAYLLRGPLLVRRILSWILVLLLRNTYYKLSKWGIIGNLLCFHHFTRIGVINTTQGLQIELLFWKRKIGYLRPPYSKWIIVPPYHLLINEAHLPKNIDELLGTTDINQPS